MTKISLEGIELDRLLILEQVKNRQLTQEEAGQKLNVSSRQIRRLMRRFISDGIDGIRFQHKGGNRAFHEDFKQQVLAVCSRSKYHGFGPTFASEKLKELENLNINRETLRQWMIEQGLWKGRTRKKARIHQSRERRPQFGELVQIDGSHHDWFEGRAPKCCLLVFVDDATSRILGLGFFEQETTLGYMKVIQQHLGSYGRPMVYYSDKHSIFRTTREQCIDGLFIDTQLERALRELRIELICAHSSQAKGRVERANKTLQDRLIKELRLRNISSIAAGNAYAPEFMADYNQRFGVEPASAEDAHLPVRHDKERLKRILSVHSERKLSKNLEFHLDRCCYQITTETTGYRLRHKIVTVCNHVDGTTEVICDNEPLEYKVVSQRAIKKGVDTKEINAIMDAMLNRRETNAKTSSAGLVVHD